MVPVSGNNLSPSCIEPAPVLTPGKGQASCSPSSPCSLCCAWFRVTARAGLRPPSPPLCACACRLAGRDEGNGSLPAEPRKCPSGSPRSVTRGPEAISTSREAFRHSTGLLQPLNRHPLERLEARIIPRSRSGIPAPTPATEVKPSAQPTAKRRGATHSPQGEHGERG